MEKIRSKTARILSNKDIKTVQRDDCFLCVESK